MKFELCERAGLRIRPGIYSEGDINRFDRSGEVITAFDVEHYLSRRERERSEVADKYSALAEKYNALADKYVASTNRPSEPPPTASAEVFTAEDFETVLPNGERIVSMFSAAAADRANCLLRERSQVVYGIELIEGGSSWYSNRDRHPPTHQALLVGVTPIVRDTAESLLREIARAWPGNENRVIADLVDRARRLLEGKEGV